MSRFRIQESLYQVLHNRFVLQKFLSYFIRDNFFIIILYLIMDFTGPIKSMPDTLPVQDNLGSCQ